MRPPAAAAPALRLRPVTGDDLPALFEFQADPEANRMAGTKPRSREAYFTAWEGILRDPGVSPRVIELDGAIVGSISRFQADGRDCVGYWIARPHWGRGIASRALALFLAEERARPLHATAASTNTVSRRILERCGFRCTGVRWGEETERYEARDVAEYVLD